MYTQCSSCATLFRVAARHLREAQGRVRCCLCHETFDALPSLTENLPADLSVEDILASRSRLAGAPAIPDVPEPPAAPASPRKPEPVPVTTKAALEDEPAKGRDLFAELDLPELAEPEAEPATARGRTRRTWVAAAWALACLSLLGLLVIQYGRHLVQTSTATAAGQHAQADFVRDPRYRPWFEVLCLLARCELPLLRDVDQVHILQRRVTAHSSTPKALLVKATLVNDANFPQPYPQLRLSFLDAGGSERASRWFVPEEYLEDATLREQMSAGMPPKQPVAVRLELADPGEGAAESFKFDFR